MVIDIGKGPDVSSSRLETPKNAGEPAHEIAPLGAADNHSPTDYCRDGELLEENTASCAASAGTATGRDATAASSAASAAAGIRTAASATDGGRALPAEDVGRVERGNAPPIPSPVSACGRPGCVSDNVFSSHIRRIYH